MEQKKEFLQDGDLIKEVNPGTALSWFEKAMQIIDKYGIIKIIQAILIVVIAIITIASAIHPDKLFKLYDDFKAREHSELIEQRTKNTPKIQNACDELLARSNADRVLFLELHNNTGNISGLPFFYAAASCESIDDGIRPVADQYMEVKLSLFPFLTNLFNNGYWVGDMSDLKKLDKSLCYRMMSNNVHHSAFTIVQGIDQPCGILIVSYEENKDKQKFHDCKEVRKDLERTARKIALLVETNRE